VHGDYACVAANVAELVIVGPGQDLATETAHEPYTCIMIKRLFRARRGSHRVHLGCVVRRHFPANN
jgi:hypothetical protein